MHHDWAETYWRGGRAGGVSDRAQTEIDKHREHRLELNELLDGLLMDGLITEQDANEVRAFTRPKDRAELHPLALMPGSAAAKRCRHFQTQPP